MPVVSKFRCKQLIYTVWKEIFLAKRFYHKILIYRKTKNFKMVKNRFSKIRLVGPKVPKNEIKIKFKNTNRRITLILLNSNCIHKARLIIFWVYEMSEKSDVKMWKKNEKKSNISNDLQSPNWKISFEKSSQWHYWITKNANRMSNNKYKSQIAIKWVYQLTFSTPFFQACQKIM